MRIKGKTLRETVKDRLYAKREDKSVTMGASFYAGLRTQFSGADSATKQLQVLDPSEPVSDALMEAIRAARATPCSRSIIISYLMTHDKPPCQKELVGVYRWMLTLRPSASAEQLRCVLECLKWIARFSLNVKFADEWRLVLPSFDSALLVAFRNWKRGGTEDEMSFLTHYKDECQLVLPWDAVETVMVEDSEWRNVQEALNKVDIGSTCRLDPDPKSFLNPAGVDGGCIR